MPGAGSGEAAWGSWCARSPDKLCTPAGLEEIDSARTTGIVSTVLLAVGGAAATGGLIMIIVGGPTEGTEAAWMVTPWASPEGGGA